MLSCASCNKWFIEQILETKDYTAQLGAIDEDMLGNNRVYFLPYLMGERSPLNDTDVRGTFIGLDASVTRREMLLAVIEGVCFALRDSLEAAFAMGISIKESTVSGGGARSPLFLRILSSVLGIDLLLPKTEQGPSYGMGILAATAAGEYENITEAVRASVTYKERIIPDAALVSKYAEKYEKFKLIYPAVKELYKKIK
jgi:xylulokinase